MKNKIFLLCAAIVLVIGLLVSGCAKPAPAPAPAPAPTPPPAPAVKLPQAFIMDVLPVGSVGYTMMLGMGEAVKTKSGIPLKVVPGGTDVARILPVAKGDAHFALLVGSSTFSISHGLGSTYSREEWGPQDLRDVWEGQTAGNAWYTRGDSGIKTGYDVKGKRVMTVPGHPMFEVSPWSNNTAWLSFFNLTWKDVVPVPIASSSAGYKAVLEGAIDMSSGDINASGCYEIAASTHGVWFVAFPHNDKEAWKRMTKIAPFLFPSICKSGPGPQFEAGRVLETCDQGYTVTGYPSLPDEIAYAFTKAAWEGYDLYKDKAPGLSLWTHERCLSYKTLFFPYHNGTVKFFKDIGVWTNDMEQWQNRQVKLLEDRIKAWGEAKEAAGKEKIKLDTPEFTDFWRKWLTDHNLIAYPIFD